jgi:hypothetical protein
MDATPGGSVVEWTRRRVGSSWNGRDAGWVRRGMDATPGGCRRLRSVVSRSLAVHR